MNALNKKTNASSKSDRFYSGKGNFFPKMAKLSPSLLHYLLNAGKKHWHNLFVLLHAIQKTNYHAEGTEKKEAASGTAPKQAART
jgi:hypothetical protein